MFKKLAVLIFTVVLSAVLTANASGATDKQTGIEFEGKKIETLGKIIDGSLLLPLRSISEAAGFTVQYAKDKTVTITGAGKTITLKVGETKITADSHKTNMSDILRVFGGVAYVPADFISDNLSIEVREDKNSGEVLLNRVQENQIVIRTKEEFSDTQTLLLNVQYPEIAGLENPAVQDKINAVFRQAALAAENTGKDNAKLLEEAQLARGIKAETYFDYIVKYNQKGILSVVFLDYQYSGGAHGLTVQRSYTFDLNTGNQYQLRDLFKENSDYVSLINREIKRQMDEKGLTSSLLTPFESIKADQDFYLANNTLVIYFQEYEYTPYVLGILEFPVQLSSLGGSLKPDFPLAKSL